MLLSNYYRGKQAPSTCSLFHVSSSSSKVPSTQGKLEKDTISPMLSSSSTSKANSFAMGRKAAHTLVTLQGLRPPLTLLQEAGHAPGLGSRLESAGCGVAGSV